MRIYSWKTVEAAAGCPGKIPGQFMNGTALTVGSFDGVHRGHRLLLDAAVRIGGERGFSPGAVTFTFPLSRCHEADGYAGDLTVLDRRLELLEDAGMEFAVVIDFSSDFARMSGTDFLEILVKNCGMRFLSEGTDFRCGRGGKTGMAEILRFADENGIAAGFIPPLAAGGVRISSSHIRELILDGDLEGAEDMLGRPYSVDCRNEGFILEDSCFCMDRGAVTQVLPPCGIYNVTAITSEKEIRSRLEVNFQKLKLQEFSDNASPRIRAIEFISH